MRFKYSYSGEWEDDSKYLVTTLAQADCLTQVSSVSNFFHMTNPRYDDGTQDYFFHLQVNLAERDFAPEYQAVDEATGVAEFCLRVDYISLEESINFHETLVTITFDWWVPVDTLDTDTAPAATTPRLDNVSVEVKETSSNLQDDDGLDPEPNTCEFEDGMMGFFRKQTCRLNNVSVDTHALLMALVPKMTAALSGGSSFLLLLYAGKGSKESVFRQLGAHKGVFVGGCMAHLVAALAWFATTWPIPASPDDQEETDAFEEWFWNVGTDNSCIVQGFFAHFSLATTVYTVGALILLTKPRFGKILRNIIHVLAWGLAIGMGGMGATLDLFQAQEWICWIGPSVHECHSDDHSGCAEERLYRYILRDGIVWICLLASISLMIKLDCCGKPNGSEEEVARDCGEQNRITREASTSTLGCSISLAHRMVQRSNKIKRMRGIALSLFACWFPYLTIHLYQDVAGVQANFWTRLIAFSLLPCQGLLVLVMIGVKAVAEAIWVAKNIPVAVMVDSFQRRTTKEKEGQTSMGNTGAELYRAQKRTNDDDDDSDDMEHGLAASEKTVADMPAGKAVTCNPEECEVPEGTVENDTTSIAQPVGKETREDSSCAETGQASTAKMGSEGPSDAAPCVDEGEPSTTAKGLEGPSNAEARSNH